MYYSDEICIGFEMTKIMRLFFIGVCQRNHYRFIVLYSMNVFLVTYFEIIIFLEYNFMLHNNTE